MRQILVRKTSLSRSDLTFCQAWSGSKLFAKVSSRRLKSPLAGNWIHLVDFPTFFTRKITFVTSCLLSCTPNFFFPKRVHPKRKEFALKGSKLFPSRVDLFSGAESFLTELLPLKMGPFPLMYQCHLWKIHKTKIIQINVPSNNFIFCSGWNSHAFLVLSFP